MPIVRYVSATKQFTPDSYGVRDVNLTIEPGELVVITGHTGSGKTTLMKLLTREYALSEGELYFNENPVHSIKSNKLHLHRRQIGVIYQDYRLIKELTVWENVALPLYIAGKKEAEIEQRTTDLLNLIKLPDKADLFPNQLSGGEAQRVSIARSLALGPELIFADEPTGNLDVDTSKTIALLLAKINELGTTLLLSTHDLTLLDIFTNERHIQLEKGAIVKDTGTQKAHAKAPTPHAEADKLTPEANTPKESASTPEETPKKSAWHRLPLVGKKAEKKQEKTEENATKTSKEPDKEPEKDFKKEADKPSKPEPKHTKEKSAKKEDN